jgi:hypothetical protein
VLLSACGSTPRRDADEASAPAPDTTAPAVTRRSGGGYYKDDGPDDEVPDNLDAIPDAEPRDEPLHRFANRPYHVMGQSFVPATELRPFRQRGHAQLVRTPLPRQPDLERRALRHVRDDRRASDAADPELCARHPSRQRALGGGAGE